MAEFFSQTIELPIVIIKRLAVLFLAKQFLDHVVRPVDTAAAAIKIREKVP